MRSASGRAEVLLALSRLDSLLEAAAAAADTAYGPEARDDPHRGLYVTPDDVARLLGRDPGAPVLGGIAATGAVDSAWQPFASRFDLDELDIGIVLLALAPEVDLRYERLYAYLQDDVTRKRPTVELVLDLLCATAEAKLEARARFGASAPLVRHGLVRLVADPSQPDPPLLARAVRLDEHLVEVLLGGDHVDGRLALFAELTFPRVAEDGPGRLAAAPDDDEPLRAYLRGRDVAGKRAAAAGLAASLGTPLLTIDLERALDSAPDLERVAELIVTGALLHGAVLYLHNVDALATPERAVATRCLEAALARLNGPVLLGSLDERAPVELRGLVEVDFPLPSAAARRDLWAAAVERADAAVPPEQVDALAAQFRLTADRIEDAVARARRAATLEGRAPAAADLFAAARAQSGDRLAGLARKVVPHADWSQLVLPADRVEQLRDMCNVLRHRALVHEQWGFERRLSLGKGLHVLFVGPSGTGKTLAAEILASELGLDMYAIDLAAVVSKYIGETEKNLGRIFAEAETANAILFFDEADALFGKRTEVRDSHDRYANIEISYLLQRLDDYDGVVILASNLRKNMDDAFVRRMHATIEFPFPDADDRRRIWEGIWPDEVPLDPGVDAGELARRFDLTGGNIRNVALAAAFIAADDSRIVTNEHVLRAARREYHKLGKVVRESDFDG